MEFSGGEIVIRMISAINVEEPIARAWAPKIKERVEIKIIIKIRRLTESANMGDPALAIRRFLAPVNRYYEITLKKLIFYYGVETRRQLLNGAFREDKRKIWRGNAPRNLSALRKVALNSRLPVKMSRSGESLKVLFFSPAPTCVFHASHQLQTAEGRGRSGRAADGEGGGVA